MVTGVTNDIANRINEHFEQRGKSWSFAGKYYCFNLLYYEHFVEVEHAIDREKEIKGWRREKKEALINSVNPEWRFLNSEVMDL
ncbi:MAG: GIY-YIG nuclease family protein [Flavobacteriales bacterium]